MEPKGEDGRFVVTVDGREELSFRNIDNIDIDDGFTTEELNYVGSDRPKTVEGNGAKRVTFTLKPGDPGYGRLIELRRARARSQETRSNVRFDMTYSINYGDGGRERWALPDCKLGDSTRNVPQRNNFITGKITLICDDPRRLPG